MRGRNDSRRRAATALPFHSPRLSLSRYDPTLSVDAALNLPGPQMSNTDDLKELMQVRVLRCVYYYHTPTATTLLLSLLLLLPPRATTHGTSYLPLLTTPNSPTHSLTSSSLCRWPTT